MKQKDRQAEIAKLQDFAGLLGEMSRETDRGAALLAGALLDNCLGALLEAFFIREQPLKKGVPREVDKLLHEPNSPLGTFSARLRASYCLGLISHLEMCDIDLIRDIRNRFAHRLHGITFATPAIRSTCERLLIPQQVAERIELAEEVEGRVRFSWAVVILYKQLTSYAENVASNERRSTRPNLSITIASV